jgi:hypothetical protein
MLKEFQLQERPVNSPDPNVLEVTGTTLPLLTTVLAGFAVTIIVQLINNTEAGELPTLLNSGLTLIALSVPLFLGAALFATWGQSYNYTVLTDELKKLIKFNKTEDSLERYLNICHTNWVNYHEASNFIYYLGLAFFILGTDLLIYRYLKIVSLILVSLFELSIIALLIIFYVKTEKCIEKNTIMDSPAKPSVGESTAVPISTTDQGDAHSG